MRRVLMIVIALVVLGGIGYGGFRYGFQQGTTAGQATAASDRAAFEASRGSAVAVGGAGGRGGQAGAGAGGNQGSAQAGGGGSQTAGAGRGGAMGASMGAVGSAAAPRGSAPGGANRPNAANGVSGRVTMVSGPTFTVQSSMDNANVNVVTGGDTIITKLVAGTTGDLKLNDFVTVQGMMTGDNAYTATAVTGTSAQQLAALGSTGILGSGGAMGGAGMGASGGRGPLDGIAVAGRITQLDVSTIMVATANGMMVTVNTTPTTKVQTTRSAAIGDIQAGDNVIVLGDRTGESVTARLVTDQGQG